ncbi:MAG TPA: GAF domain-containing protein [Anaerolineales bacterium]|nr:GAF domain-containing protein [Anaerolineales bacterium]
MNEAYGLRALQQEAIHLKEENRQLHEQLSQLRHAIRALNLLDQSLVDITPQTNVYELIHGILMAALQAVGAEEGSLLLLDEETQELVFVEVVGQTRDRLMGTRMPKDQGIVGSVISQRAPILVEDVRLESHWYPHVAEMLGFETLTVLCVPVMDRGRVFGAIELVNKRDETAFDEEDQDVMVLVARLAAMTLTRAEEVTV